MKNQKYRIYIAWGATAFITIVLSILFFFALFKIGELHAFSKLLSSILQPIIIGAALGYVLTPVYNRLRRFFRRGISTVVRKERLAGRLASGLSIALSLALVIFILYGMIAMVVPELVSSVMGIVGNYDVYYNKVADWFTEFMENDTIYAPYISSLLDSAGTHLNSWINNTILPNLKNYLVNLSLGVVQVLSVLLNLLIGLIVTAYLLGCKDTLCAQSKKLIYGCLKLSVANLLVSKFRYAHHVFGGFINGKILDSLIIGILCFIGCSLLQIPYAMLVSVIVGVTNVIPFFGPFIGAIPSGFLILLNNPLRALIFAVFILALQQFDGNILGPKILGDTTGLSSFWVLFSILLFGGLFGFVGMVIGVPVFAVIYSLVKDLVEWQLGKKSLSEDTNDYRNLYAIASDGYEYRDLERRPRLRKEGRGQKAEPRTEDTDPENREEGR